MSKLYHNSNNSARRIPMRKSAALLRKHGLIVVRRFIGGAYLWTVEHAEQQAS